VSWSSKQKNEETPKQRLSSPTGISQEMEVACSALASMPSPPLRPDDPRSDILTIGKAFTIKGQIVVNEDLYIDGNIEGSVELQDHKVTIGPHGIVQATLKAREVVVVGCVRGDVEASERLVLRKDAHLVGNIQTAAIIIEDGAYLDGTVDLRQAIVLLDPQVKTLAPASC
jgi:cytoskeletal protein CcmA (bactofilin family)